MIIATHFIDCRAYQATVFQLLVPSAKGLNALLLIAVDYSKYAYLQIV